MKRHFLALLFLTTVFVGYAQGFDDMAYINPDIPTYFQQEMTSLMKFQSKYNLNVPFFLSFSGRAQGIFDSSPDPQFPLPDGYPETETGNGTMDMKLVTGFQFKLSRSLYLPFWFLWGMTQAGTGYTRDIIYKGEAVKERIGVGVSDLGISAGSGLFINTDKLKGGIYMGWTFYSEGEASVYSPSLDAFMRPYGSNDPDYGTEFNYRHSNEGFKIALVPLVNTSEWKYIGKALESILGYFGLGNTLMNFAETDEDTKTSTAASAINAALDFAFNRIHWGNFSLDIQAMYNRGNFDLAAKADTYGAKLTGLFSNFPFGFTFEGGYKHFYSFAQPVEYFASGYPSGTGYFNGSIYFPFKRITFGLMYEYDGIYKSLYGIAISSNTFSGFGKLFSSDRALALSDYGIRFRWNGWKAGK
jgi:hypothetical protein